MSNATKTVDPWANVRRATGDYAATLEALIEQRRHIEAERERLFADMDADRVAPDALRALFDKINARLRQADDALDLELQGEPCVIVGRYLVASAGTALRATRSGGLTVILELPVEA